MDKPRLFLSHSTENDPDGRAIIDQLEAALGKKFSILLDRSTLPVGADWRNTLNIWTGTCDAAITLITPTSIQSEFCQYEWSILGFRSRGDLSFPVIPIYHKVNPTQINQAPHQLGVKQGITFTTVPVAVKEIRKLLGGLVRNPNAPAEKQVGYVASKIEQYVNDAAALKRAAAIIKLDLGTWDPAEAQVRRFARRLIGTDLNTASAALDEIVTYFRNDKQDFYDLLEIVSSSWVDFAAETTIRERALKAERPRDVALNAIDTGMARFCVLRASGKPPLDMWRVAEIPNAFANFEGLITQIYISLAGRLNKPTDPVDRTLIKKLLALMQEKKSPVIVALRADGVNDKLLTALREEFKTVMFFLLTGDRAVAATAYPDVEILKPALAREFESVFLGSYDKAKDFFDAKPDVFRKR